MEDCRDPYVLLIDAGLYPDYELAVEQTAHSLLARHGLSLLIDHSYESAGAFIAHLTLRVSSLTKPIGVIALPPPCGPRNELVARLPIPKDYPFVTIDRSLDCFPVVLPNHEWASTMAVERLVKEGYRNVVFVGGDPEIQSIRLRRAGYEFAMGNLTPKLNRPRCFRLPGVGEPHEPNDLDDLHRFIRLNRAERIAFYIDSSGRAKNVHAIVVAILGEWPQSWAITHFDELAESNLSGGVFQGLRQPKEEIAEEAVKLLLRRVNRKPVVKERVEFSVTPTWADSH